MTAAGRLVNAFCLQFVETVMYLLIVSVVESTLFYGDCNLLILVVLCQHNIVYMHLCLHYGCNVLNT